MKKEKKNLPLQSAPVTTMRRKLLLASVRSLSLLQGLNPISFCSFLIFATLSFSSFSLFLPTSFLTVISFWLQFCIQYSKIQGSAYIFQTNMKAAMNKSYSRRERKTWRLRRLIKTEQLSRSCRERDWNSHRCFPRSKSRPSAASRRRKVATDTETQLLSLIGTSS